jgi:hypothetical protein
VALTQPLQQQIEGPLAALDLDTLVTIVCRIVDDPTAQLTTWRVDEVPVMWPSPLRAGLYRVSGTASLASGVEQRWSTILRIAQSPTEGSGAEEGHWRYWRREERLVHAGLLDDLPAGFAVPRHYQIAEQADGRVWLWMEDLRDEYGGRWPPDRLVSTGRHVGRFHGLYVERAGQRPLPDVAWLPRNWLRPWLERVGGFDRGAGPLFADAAAWAHPLVRHVFPIPVQARVTRLWHERELLLAGLDRLPKTLCHGDTWQPNLFARTGPDGQPETAVIDWELANVGPIGGDLGHYLVASLYDLHADCLEQDAYLAFFDAALDQYVRGLSEVARLDALGGDGDERRLAQLARFGCAAYVAVKWGWVYVDWAVRSIVDDERRAGVEARYGRPIEEVARHRAAAVYATLDLADRARRLLPEIG